MVNLIEHLREHGYYDIKVVEIRRSYLKLIVDGNIVEIRKKKNIILVRAFRVNPHLAKIVWNAFSQ